MTFQPRRGPDQPHRGRQATTGLSRPPKRIPWSKSTKKANVYDVPWTIDLSSYGDSRGEQITAVGKGFKNGTTTTFWIDKNQERGD